MEYKILRHQKEDTVGISVFRIKAGEEVAGKDIATGQGFSVYVTQEIPIFHKVALEDIKKGEPIEEYGQVIGEATENIGCGDYVHIHNIKTRKW